MQITLVLNIDEIDPEYLAKEYLEDQERTLSYWTKKTVEEWVEECINEWAIDMIENDDLDGQKDNAINQIAKEMKKYLGQTE